MKIPALNQYPKEVLVRDEHYKVIFVGTLDRKDKNKMGLCDPEEHTIKIKMGMSATETFNTFLHEVLHAMEFEYNLKISHKLVYQLELAISNFLFNNF